MSRSSSAYVKVAGTSTSLRFDACRVFLAGEFAGNIELDIACDAACVESVMNDLRVRASVGAASDMALGNGAYPSGTQLTFWLDPSNLLADPAARISLLWGETPIGEIAPTTEDSVPIEQQARYIEPAEILQSFPVSTSNHVLLAAVRHKAWLLLAALEIVLGSLVAIAFPGLELGDPIVGWVIGGSMIASGLAIGGYLGLVPCRQVWLDRGTGRVLLIEGRTRNPQAEFSSAPSRPLDAFHHVRVFQRWSIGQGGDDPDQEVWFVTLEAEIPFASEDGTVHLHDDALPIADFASGVTARRVAAEIAYHTGLRILDTGHDQTA